MAGPDGNLWFADAGSPDFLIPPGIGEFNPTTHAISEFPIDNLHAGPAALAVGPDGNLWFTTGFGNNQIGGIQPDDPRHHPVPPPRHPIAEPT